MEELFLTEQIVICNSCKKAEYWEKMRWSSGRCLCRNCYRSIWEQENKKSYSWNDLEGKRPTIEEYKKQEEDRRKEEQGGSYIYVGSKSQGV